MARVVSYDSYYHSSVTNRSQSGSLLSGGGKTPKSIRKARSKKMDNLYSTKTPKMTRL